MMGTEVASSDTGLPAFMESLCGVWLRQALSFSRIHPIEQNALRIEIVEDRVSLLQKVRGTHARASCLIDE
jgi:hypothetical protein